MKYTFRYLILSFPVLVLLAPVKLSMSEVPISLQTFVLFTLASIANRRSALIMALFYLALGAIGMPVFAGFKSGAQALAGSTAGFLWAFPLACFLLAWRSEYTRGLMGHILNFIGAHILVLIVGFTTLYLMHPKADIMSFLLPILPGMFIKSFLGGFIRWRLPDDTLRRYFSPNQ